MSVNSSTWRNSTFRAELGRLAELGHLAELGRLADAAASPRPAGLPADNER